MSVIPHDPCNLHADIGRNPVYQQTVIINACPVFPDFFQQFLFIKRRRKQFQIFLINKILGIFHAFREEISPSFFCRPLALLGPGSVFGIFTRLQIDIIQIKIIPGQGIKYSLINRACIQSFLISRLCLLFFFLRIHHLRDVH